MVQADNFAKASRLLAAFSRQLQRSLALDAGAQ
jgi:hypothetical protein